MRLNISGRQAEDDHIISPASSHGCSGKSRPSTKAKQRGVRRHQRTASGRGGGLYFPFSISFDFICSMELFTLSSESLSLLYLFSTPWASVQTQADLYLNVSPSLSGSHYSRAGGLGPSILHSKLSLFALAAIPELFCNANYSTG